MGRWLALAPIALLAAIAAVAVFVLTRGADRAPHFEARIGRQTPAYELVSLEDDGVVTTQDFAGRPYLINLFASWCAPCRAEHPLLMRLKGRGVPILGVAYKDRPEAARALLESLGDPFARRALDPEGRFGLDLGIAGVPETFVIGADGRVLYAHRGALTEEALARDILPALGVR